MQWKFAFLSLGRPEYLQDGDIVASRFQVGGVWFIAGPVMVWYLIPECIAEGKMFYSESDYLVLLVGSCRRETLMVPGNTTWVWSMQIQPPNALMLQTRSSITFSLLVLKRWYWSSMQFSPLFQFGMKIHVLWPGWPPLHPPLLSSNQSFVVLQNRHTFEKPVKIYNWSRLYNWSRQFWLVYGNLLAMRGEQGGEKQCTVFFFSRAFTFLQCMSY